MVEKVSIALPVGIKAPDSAPFSTGFQRTPKEDVSNLLICMPRISSSQYAATVSCSAMSVLKLAYLLQNALQSRQSKTPQAFLSCEDARLRREG